MDSEAENLEVKITSSLDQLHVESSVLQKMVYKNKNQHRRSSYFQFLLQVRRDLRLLQAAKLGDLVSSCFQVISGKKPKQKIHLLESLKRRKCEVGKYNFMERLLGAARLLSAMVEPIFKAASILFYNFGTTGTHSSVSSTIFNMVSSLAQKKQAVKINQRGIEVFREFFPTNDEFVILECDWKEDKFILQERKQKIETGDQEDLGPNVSLAASAVRYQSIESIFLGVVDEPAIERAEANQSMDESADLMKMSENNLVVNPSKKVNDAFIEDDTETKDGSVCPVEPLSKTFPHQGSLLVNSGSSFGAKKFDSRKPAFVSVKNPPLVSCSAVGFQLKETKVDSEDKEDPFFSLLTAGKAKSSLF